MSQSRILTLTTRYQVLTVALASLLCLWLWAEGFWGLLVGGGFAIVNFWVLRFLLLKVMQSERRKLVYGLLLAGKTVAALAVLTVLFVLVKPNLVATALGLATLFVGIGLATLHVKLMPESNAPAVAPVDSARLQESR